jgi:hypothetical protein
MKHEPMEVRMQRSSSSTVSRRHTSLSSFSSSLFGPRARLSPLVHAMALMLAGRRHGAAMRRRSSAFSGAWFNAKGIGAEHRRPHGLPAQRHARVDASPIRRRGRTADNPQCSAPSAT